MRFNPDEYITVHERIEKFYARFPQGRIITAIIEHDSETGFILMRAEVYRDPEDALPAATGHAYELRSAGHVQQGSYVEVCETSAVGRALALLGFEVRRGVASREERGRRRSPRRRRSGRPRSRRNRVPRSPRPPQNLLRPPRNPPCAPTKRQPNSTRRFSGPPKNSATTRRRFESGSTRSTRSRAGLGV
ncbi:MAG: hypothetical protein DMF65_14050 [Acidobacteria bacterium]|nr:MAG: hypothetical protein DMF65_14050 [Acidobacteriota bacterium]